MTSESVDGMQPVGDSEAIEHMIYHGATGNGMCPCGKALVIVESDRYGLE